jgi:hypothetical protein
MFYLVFLECPNPKSKLPSPSIGTQDPDLAKASKACQWIGKIRSPVSNRHKLKIFKLDPTRQVPARLQASIRVARPTKLTNCQVSGVLLLEIGTGAAIPD